MGHIGVAGQRLRLSTGRQGSCPPIMPTPRKFWQSRVSALPWNNSWLVASDQAQADEKTKQARLRDRLATADLGVSVQLDVTASTGCY